MKPYELARLSVETYINENVIISAPSTIDGVEVDKAGTFVSLKTGENLLRGCIGTITATKDSVSSEIIHNAISAATKDPRFKQVSVNELAIIKYSVDILHESEKIYSFEQLNPAMYGIIVKSPDNKQALLLPNLQGIDTVEKQVTACMQKANITPGEQVAIYRFKVDRFSEE